MPTNKLIPTSKKSGTIKLLPYKDWEFPEIKNDDGEVVPKYPEAIRAIGYECNAPTTFRVGKAEMIVKNRNLNNPKALMKEFEQLSKYVCNEIITDWFDDPDSMDTEDEDYESELWVDAKNDHQELLCNNPQMLYKFWDEYRSRFNYEKKRELDGF